MPETPQPPGVFIEEIPSGAKAISGVATSITAFVGQASGGPVEDPVPIAGWEEYEATFGGLRLDSPMGFAVRDFFRNGGLQALVVRVPDGARAAQIATGSNLRSDQKGLYALEKADLFNLLCIPPYLDSGDVDSEVLVDAAAYCEKRRAILLVDPPSAWTDTNAVARVHAQSGLTALGSHRKNAALYFPRLLQPNPLRDDRLEPFAPSGAVAGVIARTDARRGVWKAPAGVEASLVGVHGFSVGLTDRENGLLNPLGVNCLRTFPSFGQVVWGARTLEGADQLASEWKYLPVRRLALFLEESLHRGTRWAVFEPNDQSLWQALRRSVGEFLEGLFRQGAFQGASQRDAFFVKCDTETTTQADIDRNRVNILVGFAPLKPAEFHILEIRQQAGPGAP